MTTQTPADELRTAARRMRDTAQAATPGPWTARGGYPHLVLQGGEGVISTNLAGSPSEDAEHIASWHPAVALAVADWLDTAGADLWAHGPLCCPDGCGDCDDDLWAPHVRQAITVARAYLGTTERVTA